MKEIATIPGLLRVMAESPIAPSYCNLAITAADEIERLALALAEITDETLTADERRDIAREALGWPAIQHTAPEGDSDPNGNRELAREIDGS